MLSADVSTKTPSALLEADGVFELNNQA